MINSGLEYLDTLFSQIFESIFFIILQLSRVLKKVAARAIKVNIFDFPFFSYFFLGIF